jgi:hydrogenase maturation protease
MGDTKFLVIGYGNPARGDDGLGPALTARLEALRIPGVTVETDYQLAIEHAAQAAEHDVVVFADAATDAEEPFYFRPVTGAPVVGATSHSVSPGQVLELARSCFGASPEGYLLGMRAHALDDFVEALSPEAEAALEAGLAHLLRFLAQHGRKVPDAAAHDC